MKDSYRPSLNIRRVLAERALRQTCEMDKPGDRVDVEEVVALSDYMEQVYLCPSLTRNGYSLN